MFRYNFVIDYRSDSKNFANDLFKRFDHMTIIEKKIEQNRQILTQLRKFLQTNTIQICVDTMRTTMQKSNHKKIIIQIENFYQRNDNSIENFVFFEIFVASDVIIDE